ncbi:hypothetical protein [Catellatospora vulcania]|nr:hypothetical protein [Catellatospora vulcania]
MQDITTHGTDSRHRPTFQDAPERIAALTRLVVTGGWRQREPDAPLIARW